MEECRNIEVKYDIVLDRYTIMVEKENAKIETVIHVNPSLAAATGFENQVIKMNRQLTITRLRRPGAKSSRSSRRGSSRRSERIGGRLQEEKENSLDEVIPDSDLSL